MRKSFSVTIFLFLIRWVYSQDLSIDKDENNWSHGAVILRDETQLKGLIKYNSVNGILSLNKGKDSQSFTPKTVQVFWFSDPQTKIERKFISLPYEDSNTGVERFYFFEILRELKNFALLSKTDPMEI